MKAMSLSLSGGLKYHVTGIAAKMAGIMINVYSPGELDSWRQIRTPSEASD